MDGYESRRWGVHRGVSSKVSVGTAVVAQIGGVAVAGMQEYIKLGYRNW